MKRLLLFLSKTDADVYKACPKSAKAVQLSFGLFVLLTAILALVSGTYAASYMFYGFDELTQQPTFMFAGYFLAPLIGMIYAILIMSIDREVVSAKSTLAVIPRLLLAIVIGFVVAVPIELKLLEGRISEQILKDYNTEKAALFDERDADMGDLDARRMQLELEVKTQSDAVAYWAKLAKEELAGDNGFETTGKKGEGPVYKQNIENQNLHQGLLNNAQAKLDDFLTNEYFPEKQKVEAEANAQIVPPPFDLLTRYETLHEIAQPGTPAKRMSLGITALFILFEIIPSLIKLLTSKTEYDALLEARRRLNIQLIHAIANEGMEEMDSDIELVLQSGHIGFSKNGRQQLKYLSQIRQRIMTE